MFSEIGFDIGLREKNLQLNCRKMRHFFPILVVLTPFVIDGSTHPAIKRLFSINSKVKKEILNKEPNKKYNHLSVKRQS